VRALWTVVAAVALTAAFLYTAGTSRAGEVSASSVDFEAMAKQEQVSRSAKRVTELVRQERRAEARREQRRAERRLREAERAAAVAAWVAAATPPFRCPVAGPVHFTDSWGDARSGGRRHQGTDMMAAYGTPVVAPVGGVVSTSSSGAGGLTVELVGDDGNTYKGMHLARYAGVTGNVASGTVIGYVGSSGNARGGSPHLHFQMHPGGGAPVNPYSKVAAYC
jgi:murein DD-endopeptidase MepM/ murein hydrolase activator NlpD